MSGELESKRDIEQMLADGGDEEVATAVALIRSDQIPPQRVAELVRKFPKLRAALDIKDERPPE